MSDKYPVYDSRTTKSILGYLAEVWSFRFFTFHMAKSLLRSRLRRSVLGIVWIVLEPMILAGIFSFVFGKLFVVDDIIRYAVYVLVGHVFFNLFAQSVNVSTECFLEGKIYMKQSRVPAVVFPIRSIIYLFTCFLYAFAGVLLVGFGTGRMVFTMQLFWVLPCLLIFLVMIQPMAIISGLANLKFGDFKQIAQYTLQILYYITPVFLPREFFDRPEVALLEMTSPTIAVLDIFRAILMDGNSPPFQSVIILSVWAAILWLIAIVWLRREEDKIVYYA